MGIIAVYVLFALTTGLTAIYEIFYPALRTLEATNPDDILVKYKWLSLLISMIGAILLAPLFIGIVLTPSLSESFRNTLVYLAVSEPEKI